jgi:hypothetical protein
MATNPLMVLSDSYGLPLTTRSREALHWYDQGIRGLLGFRRDTLVIEQVVAKLLFMMANANGSNEPTGDP